MRTIQFLNLMRIFCWVIFIGLCIKAGAIIFSGVMSFVALRKASEDVYMNLDLSYLYDYNIYMYFLVLAILVSLAILKAQIFYIAIKILTKLNIEFPFNTQIASQIKLISLIAFIIGLFAMTGNAIQKWLDKELIPVSIEWESTDYLFISGVIFLIALLFQRGVEIQSENELTI